MVYPDLEKFKLLAASYNRVTIYREIAGDTYTPISLLRNFSNEKYMFLLESANLDKSFSRYSFFGIKPSKILRFSDGKLIQESKGKKTELQINPIDFINSEIASFKGYSDPMFGDFSGGYVGFFGYEMVNYMGVLRERVAESSEDDILMLMLVDEFYVFDNHFGRLYAAKSISTKDDFEKAYQQAMKRTDQMAEEISKYNFDSFDSEGDIELERDYEKDEFIEKVNEIKSEIENGEVIQMVFSNRYRLKGKINSVNLYRALRNVNPSPYMFYLKFGSSVVCGSSPEIHLKVVGRKAILKPIAGTYPVSEDIEKVKNDLLSDTKEVAEHLMLLDLARNDLNISCKAGSVNVVKSFVPEVYSHVVHIVSEVEGELKEGVSSLDTFVRTFPAGTVSGAPKVRAMELINKYERSRRGFYAGCTGYISFNGNLDTCITIRSALVKKDETIIRAGAGIVYDSVPEKEFYEVEGKLKALFMAIERVKNLEEKNVFTHR